MGASQLGIDLGRCIRAALILLLLLFTSNFVSAQSNVTSIDTIQLWVTVSEKTMVDIQPDLLAWQNVPPGSETLVSQAVGFPKEAVQIENIGSTNISYIWFNNSYPNNMPFGSGDPSEYDAGNFVIIRRNQSGADWFFPNRVEYNESTIIYLQLPSPESDWAHGRFRSANKEWFWAVNASSGVCNESNFRIGKVVHNQSQLGSVDLRACDAGLTATGGNPCREGDLTATTMAPYANGEWGWSDLYMGDNTNYENYTVAVYHNCSQQVTAMFYHWNKDAPGAQEGAIHPEYFHATKLNPGEHIVANVKLRVPYGTAAGNITGALTVTVQAIDVGG
jgi:hypothetical protein